MNDFSPTNLDPIQDVIKRVRLVKKPSYKNKDCSELEKRFWHQDWNTQLDIYELWLDIDSNYSRTCLYRVLDDKYWELLQELVDRGIERAEAISKRILENSIKHMRTQIVAFFVTENAPLDVVRKYKKQLAYSLEIAYDALALRIGGDKDFVIDKDRLYNRLEYFDICAKFNIPVSDEEAIDELKLYFESRGRNIWCDTLDATNVGRNIQYSLLLNRDIKSWRTAIGKLGLNRAALTFDRWDADLQYRINNIYEADNQYRSFPEINYDRLVYYWAIFIEMAVTDLFPNMPDAECLHNFTSKCPEIQSLIGAFGLRLVKPLEL